MKILLVSTAAVLVAASSIAQNAPQPVPRAAGPAAVFAGGGGLEEEAARFDLKFPGGKVKEFVAAVSKALGKPVNLIIPKEGEGTMIPAVDVSRVTVSALFKALSTASQHQVAFFPSRQNPSPLPQPRTVGGSSVQFKTMGFTFKTEESNPSPDAVWTFISNNTPDIPADEPLAPPRTVQYYPVAEYLSHFSVEDITTAIESGWKLQGDAENPPPTIRFHEETKLLIIAGTKAQMELIPQVLQGLSQMLRYPRSENLKITRKASGIIVPKVEFKEATVQEAVDFLRRKAFELDPEKQGFNVVLRPFPFGEELNHRVTLNLSNIPALQLLKYVATLAGMNLEIQDHAILLGEGPLRATPSFTPAPADAFPLPGFPEPPTPPALPRPPLNSPVTVPAK